ncbi:MlaD family protein [Nocardia sp. BMG51109]|uniref:MlaD family protein n=1 Tax=Nocardia sp. BMG51109 TaxID=1056816 RepID=UPI0004646A4F|nr:MlaD family protein [Nocardia sp. BMG51109]
MKRVLASPGVVTVLMTGLVTLVVAVSYVVALDPLKKTIAYCALMPDAIGLYSGNHVTMRGIRIGTVGEVRPGNGAVRVEFTVDAERPLRGDVMATTVADTIIADRDLEVLSDPAATTDWNRGTCITETFTPKSITETLRAFSTLADELNGAGATPDRNRIADAVEQFHRATEGTGPRLNQVFKDLGTALQQPDAAIGHIGALIDAFASLVSSISGNWGDIKTALVLAEPGVNMMNDLWQESIEMIDSLRVVVPMLNDISRKYGRQVLNGLDQLMPSTQATSANIATTQQMVDMVPAVVQAFRRSLDPETGQVRVEYAPPVVALAPPQVDQVCAAIAAVLPGGCRGAHDGLVNVDLVTLVLGAAGAR